MFKKIAVCLLFLGIPNALLAERYPIIPGSDVIGQLMTIRAEPGETLDDIGDRYGLGYHEMLEANPNLGDAQLGGGEEVILPTAYVLPKYRKGIVINVAECRLYYFSPDGRSVFTYPVGLGRKGWRTPTTSTTVIRKSVNPTWTVPNTIHDYVYEQTGKWLPHVVPPGPENPLGPYAMYLGTHGYLIHGTNQPWSIGKLISAGCIRLHNQDVAELYKCVKTGTPVRVIHQPYKAGWCNGRLYLEAHVPVKMPESANDLNMPSPEQAVLTAAKQNNINWEAVRQIVEQQNGMPEPIVSNNQYCENY